MSLVKERPKKKYTSDGSAEDLVLFHRTLAEMCRANVPLPEALRLLSRDLERAPLRSATQQMAKDIDAGLSLAEAYASQERHLPPLYQALIQAGISSGDLPSVLEEVSRHAGERAHIAARVRTALFYPMVSAVGVIAVGVVMFLFLGPQVESMAHLANFAPAKGIWGYVPWITLGVFTLLALGTCHFVWLRHPLDGGVGPRGIGFRLPFVGRLRTYAAKAGFASTMAMLIGRSVPLPQSLGFTAAATDDAAIADQVETMRRHAVQGEGLTGSIRAGDLISPAMLWFIEAGETGGQPARCLADVATIYRQRLDRGVDRMCALLTPVTLLLTGLVVVGFAMAYLLPIYQGQFSFLTGE